MDERAASAAAGRVPARKHLHHVHERLFFKRAIRIRLLEQGQERVLAPLAGRGFRNDLLRQHIEGLVGHGHPVELAVVHRAHHGGALRSSRVSGNIRPFGTPLMVWPERPTRCRKVAIRCGEEIWHTRSTWPMSMPSSSDAVATRTFSFPLPQPLLGVEPRFLRQAAVVRGHVFGAEALGELVRHSLRQAPRVHRDQRGAMRLDQRDRRS